VRRLAGVSIIAVAMASPFRADAQPLRPAQSVGDLQSKAAAIAQQLTTLQNQSDKLNEDALSLQAEQTKLQAEIAANQADVETAKTSLGSNQALARQFAVDAYVGGVSVDPLLMSSADSSEMSNRKVFLERAQGDRQQIIGQVNAAQQDLADKEAKLAEAKANLDRKSKQLADTKSNLESSIADQTKLQDSVKGQLADAVAAEQARIEAAAAAAAEQKARADAQAAAAQVAAQQRADAAARAAAASSRAGVTQQANSTTTAADTSSESDDPTAGDTPNAPSTKINFAPAGPVPAGVKSVIDRAMAQQGVPYRWGGMSPGGFDCSGLVLYAYQAIGMSLPHSSRAMRSMTQNISADQLQPGDLVFGGSPVHHVGLYIGGGQMIHAPHSGDVVRVAGIYSSSGPVSFGRL
jgi:cell wall-associated NlpC family hydrolase